MKYVTLHKEESFGFNGYLGIEIKIAASNLPDLEQDQIRSATRSASEKVVSAVRLAIKAADPTTSTKTAENKKLISDVFSSMIFVDEIENGYCNDWCCSHLPWFIVTTEIGRFTIGWRKRVISIDWSQTVGTKTAEELFADEDVTKGEKSIHAWSVEKAKSYIDKIIDETVEASQ
jgi:hypothetical protein